MMRELFKIIIEKFIPVRYQLALRFLYLKKRNKLDDEMFYVEKLLNKKRRFLDIGANVGIYSYYFKNIFEKVDAFEPLGEITHRLKSISNESLKVHNVALSNKIGFLKFHIPLLNGKPSPPLASLEDRDGLSELRTVKVKMVDDYDFDDVDLIKIDVEGHEQSVIEGALKVIKKNKPLLIVEIEQRHIKKDINEVFDYIIKLDYSVFFLRNEQLTPLTKFSYETNQKPFLDDVMNSQYINNFIFIPNKSAKRV
jgi:FkbM family methyltransferase